MGMSILWEWEIPFCLTGLITSTPLPGSVAQLVASLTADPMVASAIPDRWAPVPNFRGDWSWNYFYDFSPPSADSRRVVVASESMCKVLVNGLVKIAQEISVVRWTDRLDMTIAVDWDVKP